jgi:hypothetical protein
MGLAIPTQVIYRRFIFEHHHKKMVPKRNYYCKNTIVILPKKSIPAT